MLIFWQEYQSAASITADKGTFILTGGDVSLINSRILNATSGTFNVAGGDITLVASTGFSISSGAFIINGGEIALVNSRVLNAASGTFNLVGGAVTLSTSVNINANSGTFTLTGGDVGLIRSRVLNVASGTFTLSGGEVDLVTINKFNADSGTFNISGSSVDFLRAMLVEAGTGTFTSTGGYISLPFQGVGAPLPGGNASVIYPNSAVPLVTIPGFASMRDYKPDRGYSTVQQLSNVLFKSEAGYEKRRLTTRRLHRSYTLSYSKVSGSVKQAIENFYDARSGEFQPFLFDLTHLSDVGTVMVRFDGSLSIKQVSTNGIALSDNIYDVSFNIKETTS